MSTEQFAVLQGHDLYYTEEAKVKHQIENHPKLHEYQIRVQSFFGPVCPSDAGLSETKNGEELTLMKFLAEKEDIPEVTFARTKTSPLFHLRRIPHDVIKSCEAELDLKKVRALPNFTSDITMLANTTGIDFHKDAQAGTLWITGKWFQVSVARSYLSQRYSSLLNIFDLECPGIGQDNRSKIKQWINMDDFMTVDEEYVPFCTFALCMLIQYVRDKDDVVFLTPGGRVTCDVRSAPRKVNNAYHELQKEFAVLQLEEHLPVDYANLLVEIIKVKFNPEMLLMHRKQMKNYFVIPKSKVAEVRDFIKTYKTYNTPSNRCGTQYLEEIANERQSKSFIGLMTASPTSYSAKPVESVQAKTSSTPASKIKMPFATFTKDKLCMNYFCTTYMDDLKDIAKQFHGTLIYNMNGDEYVLEIHADLPEDRETIRKYMEEVFNNHCIRTELVHVQQLIQLSTIQDPIHIAPGNDASTVYVTGPLTTLSELTLKSQAVQRSTSRHEDQQAHLEAISIKTESASSTRKHDRKRQNRQLVESSSGGQTQEEDLNKVSTPGNGCGTHYLGEIANERQSKPFIGSIAASANNASPEGPMESAQAKTSRAPGSKIKTPFATFKKDKLHMNYFCTTYMEDLKDIAKQFHGTLIYNMNGDEYILEIHAELPGDRETIWKYMEEVFSNYCILTELVHGRQLIQLSDVQDPVHIAPGKDASTVYVTGPLTTISQLTSNSKSS